MKRDAGPAGSIERTREPEFLLRSNPELLDFSSITPVGNDAAGAPLVDVRWANGSALRRQPAATPAFTLVPLNKAGPEIILTLERADHLQSLHLSQGNSGSYFTPIVHEDHTTEPVTLEMVMHRISQSISQYTLRGEWQRRTLEVPTGELPAREGVISFAELLEIGIIDQAAHNLFLGWRKKITSANLTPGFDVKQRCIDEFSKLHSDGPDSLLSLRIVRESEGGVVVPHVYTRPQPTSQMMVELTRDTRKGVIYIHTVAPGRKMPRHPIPRLYRSGGGPDPTALHNAAWLWSHHALVDVPPDEQPYLQRTIDLLRSTGFQSRFVDVQTETAVADFRAVETHTEAAAECLAKREVKELAALRIATTVQNAKRLKRDWQQFIDETREEVLDFTDGRPLQEYLTEYHLNQLRNTSEYLIRLATAKGELEQARAEAREWLTQVTQELELRNQDPRLLRALEAWATSPDSTSDRAHDGMGYNAGLLHFFEYRGALHKRRRFEQIEEPATVDGFISFSERLVSVLEDRHNLDADLQVAIIEDAAGNQRTYILLPGTKGEFIVAFKKSDEATPKLTAMFNRVTQQSFERMVQSVLEGHDRGQINRLGAGIKPVVLRMKT